ncbi:hypothetical protein V1L54_18440 [Streptomyces sp. TRM 70361]|uniref:hypothetical protein n=1 Tax=Streptomyces sp. TRM 70361 TaxID=3116553 RepID=UPI002E7BEAC2|nr:hypothetical protein [Streptomyces sp. TRM 70361]MEE1941362.1 hypothetical protein [Streptomyces sp. TRM 70361]
MPNPDVSPRAAYTAAVESLADRVLGALRGAGDPVVIAAQVEEAPDPKAALAAVRVLGPDVFAPALFGETPFGPADVQAVAESFRLFPPAPDATPETAWRDWTTARLLLRYGGDDSLGAPEPRVLDDGGEGPGGTGGGTGAPDTSWRVWSLRMAQLSPLALPGVDGPVHEAAARRSHALARGTARAMLRRDYPIAACLARWLAHSAHRGARPCLDVAAVVRHIELHGVGGARTALDTAIARRLLDRPEHRGGPTP